MSTEVGRAKLACGRWDVGWERRKGNEMGVVERVVAATERAGQTPFRPRGQECKNE